MAAICPGLNVLISNLITRDRRHKLIPLRWEKRNSFRGMINSAAILIITDLNQSISSTDNKMGFHILSSKE